MSFSIPIKRFLNRYAKDSKELIIVKNLVTDAPLQTVEDMQTATLEKILMDILVSIEAYYPFSGAT